MEKPTLFLICGMLGAGKTTLAKLLEQQHQAIRLCPDEWITDLGINLFHEAFRSRLEKRLMLLAEVVLHQNSHVIIEFGSWAKEERLAIPIPNRSSSATYLPNGKYFALNRFGIGSHTHSVPFK